LQASAQALQQASSCLPHSVAQASQHFTHNAQRASENCESLAHNLAQSAQMSAQSRQILTHASCPAIVEHIVQHFSHSIMQAKQASMQFFKFFIIEDFRL
jgi:predicted Zn-dependent protease